MLSLALAASLAQAPTPCIEPFSFYGMRTYTENPEFSFLGTDWVLAMAPADYKSITFHIVKDGTEVQTDNLNFYDLAWPNFKLLEQQGPPIPISEPGDYVAEFRLSGQAISKLPFTLKKASSGDPFNPTNSWTFITPIDRMGQLYAGPDKDGPVTLGFLLDATREGFARSAPWRAKVFHNGNQIAESGELKVDSTRNKAYWAHFMQPLPNGRQDPFNYSEMMKLNGALRFEVHVAGKKVRSFTYNVSGGAIKPHPRSETSYQPSTGYYPPRKIVGRVDDRAINHAWWADSQ